LVEPEVSSVVADSTSSTRSLDALLDSVFREWIDELHYKRPHYPGLEKGVAREVAAVRAGGRWTRSDGSLEAGIDPVTDLLLQVLRACSPGMDEDFIEHRADVWQRAETTINTRFRLVCELLDPERLSRLFERLVPSWSSVPPMSSASIWEIFRGRRRDGDFGQPDLLFLGGDTSLSIEMKVRGGNARAVYDADQHYRYLRLGEELTSPERPYRRARHVLLAPICEARVIRNQEAWLTEVPEHGRSLRVRADRFRDFLEPRRREEVLRMESENRWEEFLERIGSVVLDLRVVVALFGENEAEDASWTELMRDQAGKCGRWGCPALVGARSAG
jgi:hypothetical protein